MKKQYDEYLDTKLIRKSPDSLQMLEYRMIRNPVQTIVMLPFSLVNSFLCSRFFGELKKECERYGLNMFELFYKKVEGK